MDFAQEQRTPTKHVVSIGIVLALHLVLGWALVSGMAERMIEVIRAPIETKIIEEVKPPPPPPPENPPPTPAPTITTTQVVPPPSVVTVLPTAPTAPPVVAVVAPPRAPVRTEPALGFGTTCDKPEYNRQARSAETQGVSTILFTMDTNGVINEATVEKSSGPTREHKMLDRLAMDAVRSCKGKPGTLDGKPEKLTARVSYVWKIAD